MLKKMTTMLMAVLVIMGVVASPVMAYGSNPTFSDVPTSYWAYEAIEEMAGKGIVAGIGDGKFNPSGNVTTAQFATMMVRAFYPDELTANNQTYPDWYGKTMHIALENGILTRLPAIYNYSTANGVEQWDSRFVNNRMTRKEMAMMLTNYLKDHIKIDEDLYNSVEMSSLPDYDIVDASPYDYYNAIQFVYSYGVIRGVDANGTFNGDGLMTRAQACTVLKKALDLVAPYNGQKIDNSGLFVYTELDLNSSLNDMRPRSTLANGKPITEENVTELIYSLKSKYPEGMPSGSEDLDVQVGDHLWFGECVAFAYLVGQDVFGDSNYYCGDSYNPDYSSKERAKRVLNNIRPGDNLSLNKEHAVVVIEKNANGIKVVEGNYNGKVHWGREISFNSLLKMEVVVTSKYPYMPIK